MKQLYLTLWHGRADPTEGMNDWGIDGPIFGPLDEIIQTYAGDVRMFDEDGELYGELQMIEGLLYYDGMYYGDWNAKLLEIQDIIGDTTVLNRRRAWRFDLTIRRGDEARAELGVLFPSTTHPAANPPSPPDSLEFSHF